MSDKRIIDLEAKQTLGSGDYLAADSAQGTYKVDANTNIMTPLANVRNNVANSSASPDKYSSSTAYKVGDMVIQNDILYKCTTACSAASWAVNSACFTATTLASVVTQLNSDFTNEKITEILRISANTYSTQGAAIAALKSTFDELSAVKRERSHLTIGNSVYSCVNKMNGIFSWVNCDNNKFEVETADMLNGTRYHCTTNTGGSTFTDYTSNAQGADIILYA
jgi:hypothetical protein